MDIVVKGRNTEVAERFRQHVEEKLAKIEKLDTKVISIDVECSKERNPRLADQR
ncbi:MAG TPA: ribosome-associated translation inhibitor RaiA, partial [Actinomycetes bacterium]|nr:ribosome-associated translation inhibitor RaiA [Actinomycetes bacterium]